MRSLARITVALALGATVPLVAAGPAHADPVPASAVAVFGKFGEWPAGYSGGITITNHAAVPVTGWRVEFDLAGNTTISSHFSAVFDRAGNHYVITNAPWNATIAPRGSTSFGWVADGHGTPVNCTLNGVDCAGVPVDRTAPGRPGPLAFDITAGLTLTWAPSTDDDGPVAYQVYESGRLLATVTDTRYVYSSGPTLPPRIYVFSVRAVDAAGNASVSAYRTLGQIWRGDEVPAAPSDLRVETPAPGLLRLVWTAPPDPGTITVPPVAGYAVALDGITVGQVGDSAIVVPAPPAGTHVFAVRTINAVDRYSAPTQVSFPVS